MKLGKSIKFLLLFFLFSFLFCRKTFGRENSFVTVVNPVRGDEFFNTKPSDLLSGVKYQKLLVDQNDLPATWLLRYDVFPFLGDFFKNNFKGHELGIFLEITPKLAQKAEVNYPNGGIFWHDANKIFLSGFKPEERIKLIDTVFEDFKKKVGYYPKSVGAWHIDAYSAAYMRRKYGVTSVLICADQFGTDGYQIWGGWWGVPYYPSKYNILIPAQTLKNKLDLVVFWWAARDPKLGYGGSVNESTYSVQVNDYMSHGLDIVYFRGLLDVYLDDGRNLYSQVTLGLENDNNWEKINNGFALQIEEIAERLKSGKVKVVTMREFSDWYRSKFQELSPEHWIGEWYMSPFLRAGMIVEDGKTYLRDLRIYNEIWPEANLLTANPWGTLSLNNPYKIDSIRFPESLKELSDGFSPNSLIKNAGIQEIPFKISKYPLLLYYLITLFLLAVFLRKNLALLFLVVLGSVSLSLTMIKSGLVYPFGIGFWGPNGHDGIWHVALINQLAKFSLGNPVFSGRELTNYHFGFDFLVAILSRVTGIIPVNMYFQILPPMMAILIGVLTYKFVEKRLGSKKSAWWATFFVYFGGSWGWLVSLIKTGKLGGESIFWANQSISILINLPYALSLIVLLWGLIKFLDYLKKPSFKNLIVCSFLFGILIQIKVYAGVITLGSLFVLLTITLIYGSIEVKKIFRLFVLSLFITLGVFLPFNLKASSLLVFSPLWFPRTMLSYADRLGWFKLENARVAYLNSGKWWKWILAEGLALTIFIFGNIGTRVIGILYGGFLWKRKTKISEVEIFLFSALAISLAIPLIFIQKGNPWNTIQFFYYFQFLMAIFAGVIIGKLWEKKNKFLLEHIFIYVTSVILVLITLPTTVATLKNDYLPGRPPSRVSIEELEALDFLNRQPAGVVLSFPFNPDWRFKFSEPKPLYAYETTAYVSALSAHPTFLEDEMNLEITGYNWRTRREQVNRFFLTADQSWGKEFLQSNNIKYIYLVKGQKMNLGLGDINGEKIFENGETVIYRIK